MLFSLVDPIRLRDRNHWFGILSETVSCDVESWVC